MSEIIINKLDNKIDICLIENNEICEKYEYTKEKAGTLGNVYMGRVEKVIVGMQAAFIDIGTGKNAFISLKDAMPKVDVAKVDIDTTQNISDVLKVGDMLVVQVKKEPTEEKGARVSTHITIPGDYIVLMPNTDILTVSQKIESKNEIDRLKEIVRKGLPSGYGAIVRTDAENIEEKYINGDIEKLLNLWKKIKHNGNKNISILYDDYNVIEKTLRDMVGQSTQKIYTNDSKVYEYMILRGIKEEKIDFEENVNLIEKYGLVGECEKIGNRKIWLKCGGYIVIDKTEALTAIDVNSGKYTGNTRFENTVLRVNEEAAIEIMKQLRLKDIGGIVIVDYIDMKEQRHKEYILEIMKKEAKKDRSKIDIRKFTELNLVEMTRKKLYV